MTILHHQSLVLLFGVYFSQWVSLGTECISGRYTVEGKRFSRRLTVVSWGQALLSGNMRQLILCKLIINSVSNILIGLWILAEADRMGISIVDKSQVAAIILRYDYQLFKIFIIVSEIFELRKSFLSWFLGKQMPIWNLYLL